MPVASGCVVEFEPESSGQHAQPRRSGAASLLIVGVGGAGGNAVNNAARRGLSGARLAAVNADAQSLRASAAEMPVQIGRKLTAGLGAGGQPSVGRGAAEESLEAIHDMLDGADMMFLLAGMGGGTGTGAAPVIARAARDAGILTIGVVTKPFHFEGRRRMRLAEAGIEELERIVDTLLVIPNQNLFRVADEQMTLVDAFRTADEVLCDGVRAISDLMTSPGLVNLDFADVRAVMSEAGRATIGVGEAAGARRAVEAAEAAIVNPLLEDVALNAARRVLVNVTGGLDMTLFEIDEAANRIREEVGEAASIIFGSTFEERLEGRIRISVVATGIGSPTADEARAANPAIRDAFGGRDEPLGQPFLVTASAAGFPSAAVPVGMATPEMSSDTGAATPSLSPRTAETMAPPPAVPAAQFTDAAPSTDGGSAFLTAAADAERAGLRTRLSAEANVLPAATIAGTIAGAIADQAIRACRTLNAAAERIPRPVLVGPHPWLRRGGTSLRAPAEPGDRLSD